MQITSTLLLMHQFLSEERSKVSSSSERFKVVSLATQGEDGFSHISLLSIGELYLIDDTRLHFCVYGNSITAQNLMERPFATLSLIQEGKHIVFKFRSSFLLRSKIDDLDLIFFEGIFVNEKIDEAGYAIIDISAEFYLTNKMAAFERWRKQWESLKKNNQLT